MSNFKPTVVKILEGVPGHRPLNKNEPKPKIITLGCPDWLMDEAKEEWKRVYPELERLGLITLVDMMAFAGYCQSYARWQEAELYLSNNATSFETENGYVQQVPQVAIAQKYLKLCQSFMVQFGLTPSSRGRMSLPSGKEDESPMKKLWKQKRA